MESHSEGTEALKKARGRLNEMQRLLPVEKRDTASAPIVGALLTVCLQHCDSILILAETGANDASAEALFRPAVESALRLAWLCEDKDRANKIATSEIHFPSFSLLMRKFLKNPIPIQGNHPTKHLHELAHAGMAQLKQHFRDERLKRNESERPAMLYGVGIVAMLLAWFICLSFCAFTEESEEAERITAVFVEALVPDLKELAVMLSAAFKLNAPNSV